MNSKTTLANCARNEPVIADLKVTNLAKPDDNETYFYQMHEQDSSLLEIHHQQTTGFNSNKRNKTLSIVKFKINTNFSFCSLCSTVHSTKSCSVRSRAEQEVASNHYQSVFYDLLKSSQTQATPPPPPKSSVNERLNVLLAQLNRFSQTRQLGLNYEHVRSKLVNAVNNELLRDLDSQRDRLLAELDKFEEECARNVDLGDEFCASLSDFIDKSRIDSSMVNAHLSQPSNEAFRKEIESFNVKLEEKRKQFFSYLFMNKKVFFDAAELPDDFLVGFLSFIEFF